MPASTITDGGIVDSSISATLMGLTYFKRYRMEIDLKGPLFPTPPMPAGCTLLAWRPTLFEAHVDAKYRSFRQEIDANVFSCFHDRDGCRRLMREITQRDGFIPQATWLLMYTHPTLVQSDPCGTIQGVWDPIGMGSIQNVGIVPGHRGKGLGSILIRRSLEGFRDAGLDRVYLEVTAQNVSAVRLYERLGFRQVKTVYKAADVAVV